MKRMISVLLALALTVGLTGCMRGEARKSGQTAENPAIPEKLTRNEDGLPMLAVYDVARGRTERMDLERYVEGVVAGEMKNDWPLEALKAQAILARTFVLKFCQDKHSRYDGADISTDVAEAQAYDAASVNDRVRRAVRETRGTVMSADGAYPYAWFHAHSGGMTELPSVALDYKGGDPDYLIPTVSEESERAPENTRRWTASFSLDEVRKAAADAGLRVDEVKSVAVGEKGASGRAATLLINGEAVSAPSFRIQIGANRLRSTLIESVEVGNGKATFTGRGFGHGVGLSQWGAYALAEQDRKAGEILGHYFRGIDLVTLY